MTTKTDRPYRLTTLPEPLAAARLKLSKPDGGRPYLAAALWALQPCGLPGFAEFMPGPFAVDDRWRLLFDPEVVENGTLSVDELAGILYHEVSHLIRDHPARAKALNADVVLVPKGGGPPCSAWNLAADFEINPSIVKDGTVLPAWAPSPEQMALKPGLLAEEYYEQVLKKVPKGSAQGAGAGQCGGCCDGSGDDDREGEKRAAAGPGVSYAHGELVKRQVAQDVREHAKARGDVPGWLQRWADELLSPRVDWRRALRAQVRQLVAEIAGAVDYTYRRPCRRQAIYGDVVMPALRAPRVAVAFILDTSGSMSNVELAQGIAEAAGVIRTVGASIAFYAVDAAVAVAKRIASPKDIVLAGGGGTDMRVGIEAALAARPRPDCLVVFTDGATPWPAADPGTPTVVCLSQEATAPAWARVVRAF